MAKSVLLVDDVQMFIEIEKEFLQYALVDILTARDGAEALEVVKARQPDIVFMDLEMPRMDGAQCCRAIKSDPAILNTPVIMVTSRGSQDNMDTCYSAGCDYFLTKPLDRDIFINAARMFIPDIDRREKRVTVEIPCMLRCNNETIAGQVRDVSSGGIFVFADYFAIPGSVVQISFTLMDGTPVDCSGRIAWVNRVETKTHKGFGIQFALMTRDTQTCLNRFLNAA